MSDRDCPHGRQIGKCADCDVAQLEAENEALKAELAEQARLNGMGSEREARLMAVNAELVKVLLSLVSATAGVEYMESEYANELSKARAALAKTQGEINGQD